jgi:hypothetical protein
VFDVYLDSRRNLLVLKKGAAIPYAGSNSATWRKSKKRVIRVSNEIKSAVEVRGYYVRKPSELKPKATHTEAAAGDKDPMHRASEVGA